VVVYAVASLARAQASPARLADLLRGHWVIENGLQVMACPGNLVIGVLSRAGPLNLAAALRHHARDPARPLATLGITLG
jgi:hypothetical protein